jgi:TatD DNase family protein
MSDFYDTHAHLDFSDFANDLDAIVARAQAAGISRIISIGTDLESSRRAIQLSERFDSVFAVVGWHPNEALGAPDDLRPALRDLASHPRVVAIGETGLDYYRLPSQISERNDDPNAKVKERQSQLFRQHLEVAEELGLNCVIHQRAALEDTLDVMQMFKGRVRGQFHCFSDDVAAMQRILALGCVVSFTGILTFKNGQNIRDTLAATPVGHFMLETDCPYLAPVPYRGKRCEPAYVREIAAAAAEVRQCSLDELGVETRKTAHEFFRKLT